ncbi:hypothetical protein DIPPA_15439 [Diplonema papillatum]|nr:hypothetical protein DIPPA_15439 [Diplonema papillatum]
MQAGFDVLMPRQISVAELGRSFSVKSYRSVAEASPLKSVKGGFVVAWVPSAVRLVRRPDTGAAEPKFCSADLAEYVLKSRSLQAVARLAALGILDAQQSPAARFQSTSPTRTSPRLTA